MKRINEEEGRIFKSGDIRQDGYIFDSYMYKFIKQDGFYREKWRSEFNWGKHRKDSSDRHIKMRKEITAIIDKIKIGDLTYLDDLPEEIKTKVKKLGILKYNGCITCGHDNPKHLDFHHRNKTSKDKDVSKFWRSSYREFFKAYNEMFKCDVYCSHHHRDVEREMKNRSTLKEINYGHG